MAMQDSKDLNWREDFSDDTDAKEVRQEIPEPANDSDGADGWQQYRRWISKAPAPRTRRSSIDPSLYTWKGYRSWTEQVKRKWTDNQDH